MFVIRPIQLSDLDILETFAHATALGMLSLPQDRRLLQRKIERSLESFGKSVSQPKDELYLFVLEDTQTGEVGGTCGVKAKSGIEEPLYFFRVETIKQEPSDLPLPKEIKILHPKILQQGPSELCTLYLKPDWRQEGLGIFLSLSRFLFIAAHPNRFDTTIMAILRGLIGKHLKRSPFWDSLGRHFLNMKLKDVCELLLKGRAFIPDFFPKHPIYVSLLSKKAQQVIGKPHTTTRPALKILRKEGFQQTNDIDGIEAGPVLATQATNIRTVKRSLVTPVVGIADTLAPSKKYIISNDRLDFRACYSPLQTGSKGIIINRKTAKALDVNTGDPIRYAPTHHQRKDT